MACQEYLTTHVTRFPTKLDQSQNNYSVLIIKSANRDGYFLGSCSYITAQLSANH
jgi:hypothetical protein